MSATFLRSLPLALFALVVPLLAQTPTAQITGRISDASDAVIPGARITVVQTETQVARSAESNQDGYYTVPLLPPGAYRLTVEQDGFRTAVAQSIVLTVQQTARLDFRLEVGAITESVEVTSAAPVLETETSSLGTLVDRRRVEQLPLRGRNAYALVSLIPGARVPVAWNNLPVDMNTTQNVMINGNRGTQNEFLLDGVPNSNARSGGPGVFPSPDAVQEFRVETNNYSAEYGRASGGVFNVVMRSGGNQLHGTLWEFHRNENVNANNFFSNRASRDKPAFVFNQFGAAAGGPIRKDKTFVFSSWESARTREGVVYVGQTPTAAERLGDFSDIRNTAGAPVIIYDPLTSTADPNRPGRSIRSAFPNNRIPTNRLNPVSLNLQEFLPAPTSSGARFTGVDNYFSANPLETDKDVFMVKGDHHFTDKHKISGSFHYDKSPWLRPDAYGNVATPTRGPQLFERRAVALDDVYVVNPSTVLNFRYGLSRTTNDRTPFSYGYDITDLGFPAAFAGALNVPSVPEIGVTGFTGQFSQANIGNNRLLGASDVILSGFDTHSWNANVTKLSGKHSIKTGFEFRLMRMNNFQVTETAFTFGPNFTQGPDPAQASGTGGYGYATFLLGVGAGTTNFAAAVAQQVAYYGGYIQDTYKATPKLTLNLGLRYEYQAPRTDRYNQFTNFDFDGSVPLDAPGRNLRGVLAFPAAGGLPRGLTDPDRNNWAPRVGFSYQLTPKTVLRGGGGVFYSGMHLQTESIAHSGYSSSNAVVTSLDGITPTNYINNPYPDGLIFPTGSSQGAATQLGQGVTFTDRPALTPYSLQWNFGIQRELAKSTVLEMTYVGNRGVRLEANRAYNQLPDQALAEGDALRTLVDNPFYGQIGVGPLASQRVSRAQLMRPFPHFTGVTSASLGYGNSVYHALQAKLEKRFSGGMTFLASYAFSKLIDDVGGSFAGEEVGGVAVQNWNNLRAERAVSAFDQPHSLVVSYILELPFGPGRRFLGESRGLAKWIVEGWQIQGVSSFQSGSPLGVSSAANTNFSQGGGQRPNWSGQSADLGDDRTIDRWFDDAPFTQAAAYAFGNAPRTFGGLRADGTTNFDFTVSRSFRVREGQSLQFRTEFFNLLNTPRFSIPGQTLGAGTFGRVSTQLNSPRMLQFGLKFIF